MPFHVAILPFEGTAEENLNGLVRDLAGHGIEAELLVDAKLPVGAYDPRRRQYHAETFLHATRLVAEELPVLGVTECDLYAGDLNFVFGLAESAGRVAVISLHRLHHGGDAATFRARVVKEAMHELGHTLGLSHCLDARCVMHFSNSLDDTDHKSAEFCHRCRVVLEATA